MFIIFIDTKLLKGYHNIYNQQEAALMKRNRVLGLILSAAIALTSVGAVSGGRAALEKQIAVSDNPAVVVSQASGNSTVAYEKNKSKDSAVEINERNFEQFEDENDVFYEPKEESISFYEDSTPYINDAITVFFADGTSESDRQRIVDSVDGDVVGKVDFMNEYEIKINRSDFGEINSLCDELMQDESVEFASCSFAEKYEPNYVPNDPWNYSARWDDDSCDGQDPYSNWWIKSTDIDKAWDYDEYFSDIKVGVVDTGFGTEHEDLKGRIEFPNGFFKKNNAPSYHGNHVAGIIGATQDNGVGLSGIVRDCKMICVDWQANEDQGQKWNNEARIMTGFVNAVRSGAKVINFSLGSTGGMDGTDRAQIVKDVQGKFNSYYVAKMLQRGYDFICCQSAGNGVYKDGEFLYAVDASNNGTFCSVTLDNAVKLVKGVSPREIVDRIIVVAAAKFNGYNTYEMASFSNGGSNVSICAPGHSIYSAYYAADNDYENSIYAYLNGTSMAAPIVTGIASLVWSINPSFTGAQVKKFVCDDANTKYEVADCENENHLPTRTGRLVNARLAVEEALREVETYGTVTGQLEWTRLTPKTTVAFTVKNSDSGETYRLTTDTDGNFSVKLPAGEYVLRVDGAKKDFAVTTGETTDIGKVTSKLPLIDFDAYGDALKDSTQEILSKLMIY